MAGAQSAAAFGVDDKRVSLGEGAICVGDASRKAGAAAIWFWNAFGF